MFVILFLFVCLFCLLLSVWRERWLSPLLVTWKKRSVSSLHPGKCFWFFLSFDCPVTHDLSETIFHLKTHHLLFIFSFSTIWCMTWPISRGVSVFCLTAPPVFRQRPGGRHHRADGGGDQGGGGLYPRGSFVCPELPALWSVIPSSKTNHECLEFVQNPFRRLAKTQLQTHRTAASATRRVCGAERRCESFCR